MMYRPYNKATEKRRRPKGIILVSSVLLLSVSVALYAFVFVNKSPNSEYVSTAITLSSQHISSQRYTQETSVETMADDDDSAVVRRRLDPNYIPKLSIDELHYRELFNDSNYVHLSAARANGIEPLQSLDFTSHDSMLHIVSNNSYRVDSMYHSHPYLVPEAVLLLNYISERYYRLMAEYRSVYLGYKFIVTSALRTEKSERRLRRVNRNATDTSCHMYGTTFDISAQRF